MRIEIDLGRQLMTLTSDSGAVLRSYPVSTSKYGAGERNGGIVTNGCEGRGRQQRHEGNPRGNQRRRAEDSRAENEVCKIEGGSGRS